MRNKKKMRDRKSEEFKTIKKEIKYQCRIAKETWISMKCDEIDRSPYEIYKK